MDPEIITIGEDPHPILINFFIYALWLIVVLFIAYGFISKLAFEDYRIFLIIVVPFTMFACIADRDSRYFVSKIQINTNNNSITFYWERTGKIEVYQRDEIHRVVVRLFNISFHIKDKIAVSKGIYQKDLLKALPQFSFPEFTWISGNLYKKFIGTKPNLSFD